MTLMMNLEFLTIKLKQIKLSMIWVEKQLKYLLYRLSVLVKSKFEYSPLGVALSNNVKKKTNTNKVNIKERKDKNLIYNSQYSFKKISMNVKNYHLTLCLKN